MQLQQIQQISIMDLSHSKTHSMTKSDSKLLGNIKIIRSDSIFSKFLNN